MKIIVDEKIPFIREPLARLADEVVYLPGAAFSPEAVKDADALIIRTRTRCTRQLLEGSRVQFIATATVGFDHIDTDYCRQAGICWSNAPSCNAASVAQYLQASLLLLQRLRGRTLAGSTLGVVGVGNVGRLVAEVGMRLGMRVLLNDPPRAEHEGADGFSPLSRLAEECDVISFHVPLVREGKYCTFHLANSGFFRTLKRKPAIVNTSRGEVVETQALLQALDAGTAGDAIIDVWENEPDINLSLLNKVFIGTPHIAGYSADGKANATRMALDALCRHFGLSANYHIVPPPPLTPVIHASDPTDALLQMYDPRRDSEALRLHPECFEQLRGNYPLRREESAYTVLPAE